MWTRKKNEYHQVFHLNERDRLKVLQILRQYTKPFKVGHSRLQLLFLHSREINGSDIKRKKAWLAASYGNNEYNVKKAQSMFHRLLGPNATDHQNSIFVFCLY